MFTAFIFRYVVISLFSIALNILHTQLHMHTHTTYRSDADVSVTTLKDDNDNNNNSVHVKSNGITNGNSNDLASTTDDSSADESNDNIYFQQLKQRKLSNATSKTPDNKRITRSMMK